MEVAARVVVAEGLDPDDVPSRIPARRGVWAITCAASRAGGAVERVADGTGVRWRVSVAE